jgi:DNA-binding ferritin-like protein (Dps family)
MNVSKTVKKLVQDIDKNNILFNHPIQRKSEQWTIEQKSLLIHSLISDYPVPPLYSVRDEEENKYSILDGKQRLTIISDFFHGQWKLIKDMPTVWVENVEYDISGLTFKELNEEVKEELEDASLLMYIFNDCSDEEIEEIFYRLNNGTALTQDQKTRAKLGEDLLTFVDEILKTNFFKTKAYFSSYQLKIRRPNLYITNVNVIKWL